MRLAARLAKESGLPILTSGGLHFDQPPSEASIMAQSLQDDFAVAVRWQEGLSRTTWENATMSAAILQPQGIKRVVLVTQAWHMPRARWSFEQAGFTVVGAPVGFLGSTTPGLLAAGCLKVACSRRAGCCSMKPQACWCIRGSIGRGNDHLKQ